MSLAYALDILPVPTQKADSLKDKPRVSAPFVTYSKPEYVDAVVCAPTHFSDRDAVWV